MGRSVGIEVTESNVKVLTLEHAGARPKILLFHEAPIPADPALSWEERATATLREALAAAKAPRNRVVASIDSGEAILREVSLPFKGDEQVRKTVRFEMESQIHNYTIEQLVVSHYKTGETDKGTLLLAAAIPKEVVARNLKIFQDAGADPAAIDLDACAIFNAMHHAGAVATDAPHLLIHGAAKFTKLIFIEQKQPRSIRTIRFSMPRAATFGALDRKEQGALVDILAKEISRFLLANAASANPEHILLTGAFEDPEAVRQLSTATRLPVQTFNLLETVDHPFEKPAPEQSARLGVPLGLALKGAGVDALGMDFRQEEFSFRRKYEALKTTALVTVELALVLLAAVALHFYFVRNEYRQGIDDVRREQARLYEAATGEKTPDDAISFILMKDVLARYEGDEGKGLPIVKSAREAWRELARALKNFRDKHANAKQGEADIWVELETLKIDQSTTVGNESFTLTLTGKVRNLEWSGLLRNEIRSVELFREADYLNIGPAPGDLYQFTMRSHKSKK